MFVFSARRPGSFAATGQPTAIGGALSPGGHDPGDKPATPRPMTESAAAPMMRELQRVDEAEKKRNAEAGRGALVAKWREDARPQKKGKAFRAVLPMECMEEVPQLLEDGFTVDCAFVLVLFFMK